MNDSTKKDLDETRRLLYMALYMGRTTHHEAVGTLINAIRHHQDSEDAAQDLEKRILEVAEADGAPSPEAEAWIRRHISRLTEELNAGD